MEKRGIQGRGAPVLRATILARMSRAPMRWAGFRPAARAGLLVGVLLFFGGLLLGGALPGPAVPASLAEFFVEPGEAARGELAEVRVFIRTHSELEAMTIAINFDEEDLALVKVAQEPTLNDGTPEAVFSSSVDINNSNDHFGNQSAEGWVHIQVRVEQNTAALAIAVNEFLPLFTLTFRVSPNAKPGASPLVFEDIPVKVLDRDVFLRNTVTAASPDVVNNGPEAVQDDGLMDGAIIIKIIGEVGFMRGDTNYSLSRDISDPILTLRSLFHASNPVLPCDDAADANDDGDVDTSDAIFSLIRLFAFGAPFPAPDVFGEDPTKDLLNCEAAIGGST